MSYMELLDSLNNSLRNLSIVTYVAFAVIAGVFFAVYKKINYNTNELLKMLQYQKDETETLKKELDSTKRQLATLQNDIVTK